MPRIYTSASDPIDFCRKCFPDERTALSKYGAKGNGPDNRGNCYGYEAEHPAYHFEDYRCEKCNKILADEDD